MAGYFGNREFTAVYFGKKVVTAIYKGAKLVWEAIRSCFGKGYWINAYPWDNEDAWENNN